MRSLLVLTLLATPAAAEPKSDVGLIIGGNFAVDHIGPTAHDEIQKRALASPKVYLGILERIALGSTPESLSSTYIPYAIGWIGANAKPEAKTLATRLVPVYRKARATPQPKASPYRNERLDERIANLVRLSR